MNRNEARRIAETVSTEDLQQMFINAKGKIKDWNKASIVNPGMSKGLAFNILTKGGVTADSHIMGKTNMVMEFGEYLPNYERKQKVKRVIPIIHQDPNDNLPF